MKSRRCYKCQKYKALELFAKNISKKLGYDHICRECTRKTSQEKNERLKGTQRLKDMQKRRYEKDKLNPEWHKKSSARGKVRYALKMGIIKRQSCEGRLFCGNKAHMHHEDYDKPLEVTWLCLQHHFKYHQNRGDFKQDIKLNIKKCQRCGKEFHSYKLKTGKYTIYCSRKCSSLSQPRGKVKEQITKQDINYWCGYKNGKKDGCEEVLKELKDKGFIDY